MKMGRIRISQPCTTELPKPPEIPTENPPSLRKLVEMAIKMNEHIISLPQFENYKSLGDVSDLGIAYSKIVSSINSLMKARDKLQ